MSFNPSRLRHARERRGLTKTALAREAGISLKEYELGDRPPGEAVIARLADTLSRTWSGIASLPRSWVLGCCTTARRTRASPSMCLPIRLVIRSACWSSRTGATHSSAARWRDLKGRAEHP